MAKVEITNSHVSIHCIDDIPSALEIGPKMRAVEFSQLIRLDNKSGQNSAGLLIYSSPSEVQSL